MYAFVFWELFKVVFYQIAIAIWWHQKQPDDSLWGVILLKAQIASSIYLLLYCYIIVFRLQKNLLKPSAFQPIIKSLFPVPINSYKHIWLVAKIFFQSYPHWLQTVNLIGHDFLCHANPFSVLFEPSSHIGIFISQLLSL